MLRSLVVAITAVACLQVVYLPAAYAQPVSCPDGIDIAADISFNPLIDVMVAAGETSQLCAMSVSGVRLIWDDTLPEGLVGQYRPGPNTIRLRDDVGDDTVRAAILIHESTHLLDWVEGRIDRTSEACYQTEIHAFTVEGLFWASVYGAGGKPFPTSDLETMINLISHDALVNPQNLEANVRRLYVDQCG